MKRNASILIAILLCHLCVSLSAQDWVIDYHGAFPSGRTHFSSGFVDEDGVTFLSGFQDPGASNPETLLMKIEPDGTHVETVYHKEGFLSTADGIIETNDHHLFVVGRIFDEQQDYLMTLFFDKDLQLLSEARYEKVVEAISFDLCNAIVDPYGNIIVSTALQIPNAYGGSDYRGVLYKFNPQGELITQHYLMAEEPDPVYHLRKFKLKQMWYREENDRLLCLAPGYGNVPSFITFDSAFNYIEEYPILRDQDTVEGDLHILVEDCYSDYWYSPEEALFFSSKGDSDHNRLRISKVNTLGQYLDYICLNERADTIDDVAIHRCMATANDSTFYFSFYQHVYCYYPGEAVVYLLNDRLEIIGRHIDKQHGSFRSSLILPTSDNGCITVNDSCNYYPNTPHRHPKITKLRKEDFEKFSLNTVQISPESTKSYPNPTNGLLYIPMPDQDFSKARCRILDQQGRLVADRIIDDNQGLLQLDVSGLNAGIYHYQIYTNDRTLLTERFVKQ